MNEEQQSVPSKEEIGIDDFAKLDLRVARIERVEPHPNADKLLKISIEMGGESRQIVAGIAPYYQPEDLQGRLIVIVANLKPAKLRGEWSHGMLLAASGGGTVTILSPLADVPTGSTVS